MGWINLEERKPPNGVYVLIAVYDYRPNVKLYHVTIGSRLNNQWEDASNEVRNRYPLDAVARLPRGSK